MSAGKRSSRKIRFENSRAAMTAGTPQTSGEYMENQSVREDSRWLWRASFADEAVPGRRKVESWPVRVLRLLAPLARAAAPDALDLSPLGRGCLSSGSCPPDADCGFRTPDRERRAPRSATTRAWKAANKALAALT